MRTAVVRTCTLALLLNILLLLIVPALHHHKRTATDYSTLSIKTSDGDCQICSFIAHQQLATAPPATSSFEFRISFPKDGHVLFAPKVAEVMAYRFCSRGPPAI